MGEDHTVAVEGDVLGVEVRGPEVHKDTNHTTTTEVEGAMEVAQADGRFSTFFFSV